MGWADWNLLPRGRCAARRARIVPAKTQSSAMLLILALTAVMAAAAVQPAGAQSRAGGRRRTFSANSPTNSTASSAARSTARSAASSAPRRLVRPDVLRFGKRVEALLAGGVAGKGMWGVLVVDAGTGEILYARNEEKYFTPASDAKLFTTALALATLGPEYRVHTSLATTGAVDADGVLHGDVILIGRGDANLSNRKFPFDKRAEREGPAEKAVAEFADAVAARGIREITGDVVADDSYFQGERFPSGWTVDDMLWSYGAAVSAIAINDNVFNADVRAAAREGDPAQINVDPDADFYIIENQVRTGARGSEEKLAVVREPGSRLIRVSGTIPLGGQTHRLTMAVEQPAEYAAKLLARLLEARGIKVRGFPRARHAGDSAFAAADRPAETQLLDHVSAPLAQDVQLLNKTSQNLHAELLLRLAAREKTGAVSYQDAEKFAADFFHSAGIADGDVVLNDGSGLSRRDLVTPQAIVQILRYAATQPWGGIYRDSLPVAGEDGTLADRMKKSRAVGSISAKTGTIEHVNSLSGYATTVRGAHLIFAIMGNNNAMRVQAADEILDGIAVAMVTELGVAAPNGKR